MSYFPTPSNPNLLALALFSQDFEGLNFSAQERAALERVRQRSGILPRVQQFTKAVSPVWGKNGNLSYSSAGKAFCTDAYTSQAGNTYFGAVRLSRHLVLSEDVGIGHTRRFLNGLRIYTSEEQPKLLAEARYHCLYYSETIVAQRAEQLLIRTLRDQFAFQGEDIDPNDLSIFVRCRVQEVFASEQVPALTAALSKRLGG